MVTSLRTYWRDKDDDLSKLPAKIRLEMTPDAGANLARRLSSKISNVHWLFVLFVLLPPVFILGKTFDQASTTWWFMVISFLLGTLIGCLVQRRIMRVDLANDSLSIRDTFGFRREIVPLSGIDDIRPIWINGYVLIRFATANCFGKYILFVPRLRLIGNPFRHPDVDDLKELVREARLRG